MAIIYNNASIHPSPLLERSRKLNNIKNGNMSLKQAMQSLQTCTLESKPLHEHESLYNFLITLCISNKAIYDAKRLRSHVNRIGYKPGVFLNNQFINLYSKCGQIQDAREVFDEMLERNVVTWNAMIAGYCYNELFFNAFQLFVTMLVDGELVPDYLTYLSLIRASIGLESLKLGEQIHSPIIKQCLQSHTELSNALINMYSKFGELEKSEAVFEAMVEHNLVSWNSLINANSENGICDRAIELFVSMLSEGMVPDEFTFGSLLLLKHAFETEELHSQIIKHGIVNSLITSTALLDAYAKQGNSDASRIVFQSMPVKNLIAWNSIIAACSKNGLVDEGLDHFKQMCDSGLIPDAYTISSMLKASATYALIRLGKQLHGLSVKLEAKNISIGNGLIAMYASFGELTDSRQAFEQIPKPDIISWNSMAQSYIQSEEFEQAVRHFIEMQQNSSVRPDELSYVSLLSACTSLAWLETGKSIHCQLMKIGLKLDEFVGSALIDMYSKSMDTTAAKKVFDSIQNKDLITWNSIISGLSQNGYLEQVLRLLNLMREEEEHTPDNFTFASVLAVCANTASVKHGRQIHALILKSETETDSAVCNALITMYSRAGCTEETEKVFDKLNNKNTISWTAMISGYVQCGYPKDAIKLFGQMKKLSVKPNGKTFIALLTACSHAGMSCEAQNYFDAMEKEYGIKPGYEHYACMVDMFGRLGKLNEAEEFIEAMPFKPDALVWKTLLSACRTYGDIDRGKKCMQKLIDLDAGDSAAYVLLSNLYASLKLWDRVEEVRQLMRTTGAKKEPGKSWIELNDRVHEFVAGDISHPESDKIYSRLKELFIHMSAEQHCTLQYSL